MPKMAAILIPLALLWVPPTFHKGFPKIHEHKLTTIHTPVQQLHIVFVLRWNQQQAMQTHSTAQVLRRVMRSVSAIYNNL